MRTVPTKQITYTQTHWTIASTSHTGWTGDLVAIDFLGLLPKDHGFNTIVTMTDRLGVDIHIAPTHMDITAEQFSVLFFDIWYCENSLPLEIVSDRDKLFVSTF